MAEGHGRQCWAHTSLICALIANCHRDAKRHRPFKPSDFDPYAKQHRRTTSAADKPSLSFLREVLESQKGHCHEHR